MRNGQIDHSAWATIREELQLEGSYSNRDFMKELIWLALTDPQEFPLTKKGKTAIILEKMFCAGASLERVPRVPRNPQIFGLLWRGTRKILMASQEILYISACIFAFE